jgi:ribosomal protein L37E
MEPTSEQELKSLLDESKITQEEYQQLLEAIHQNKFVNCTECGNRISDKAEMCPQCGLPRRGRIYGFEYKSKRTVFGLPLVHIVNGPAIDPTTGKLRIAKGIIAIGVIAVGGVALGSVAIGLVSFGGLALGLLVALGGGAVGIGFAAGGLAIGGVAVGGCAVGYYAMGGAAVGVHSLGYNMPDDQLPEWFRRFRRR